MNEELIKEIEEAMIEVPTNRTWSENGVWKGWRYSPDKSRYYFDDIGHKSLLNVWNDPFLLQADDEYSSQLE